MNAPSPALERFPQNAEEHLQTLYRGNKVEHGTDAQKIAVLRTILAMEDTVIAADNGIPDEATELRALEFYILSKHKLI